MRVVVVDYGSVHILQSFRCRSITAQDINLAFDRNQDVAAADRLFCLGWALILRLARNLRAVDVMESAE